MKTLEARIDGNNLALSVSASRLDALTAADFKRDCAELWEPTITAVRVDLAQVYFIDSSGVGALLSLYKRLPPPNPSVTLCRIQPPVQAVIELLRLHKVFEIEA